METQAQVVSKGMKWSSEMAQKAASTHFYMKVGDKSGSLALSGATNMWKKSPSVIYLSGARIAGNTDVISKVLKTATVPDDQISHAIADAYTVRNYNIPMSQGGKAEIFNKEIDDYVMYRKTHSSQKGESTGPTVFIQQLGYYVDNLPNALQNKITTNRKVNVSVGKVMNSTKPSGNKGSRVPLQQRLKNLATGRVLDVSGMKDGGAGIKTMEQPGPGSRKFGVPGLNIVSGSLENYIAAIHILGPEYEKYIEHYKQVVAKSNISNNNNILPQIPVVTANTNGVALPALPHNTSVPNLPHVVKGKVSPSRVPKLQALPQTQNVTGTLPQVPVIGSPHAKK